MTYPEKPTKEQALQKAKRYCAYQERCHSEVKEKLYGLGLHKSDADELLSLLIEENYLNEERFAVAYAGGKFRIKHWGRMKIKYHLKQKQVSDYNIKKALASIDEKDYLIEIRKLIQVKWKALHSEKNLLIKRKKLTDHLIQKGFEYGLVQELIAVI